MMPRSTRSTRSGRPLPSHANAGELDNQVVESGHNGPERRDRILAIAEAALLSLVTLAAAIRATRRRSGTASLPFC